MEQRGKLMEIFLYLISLGLSIYLTLYLKPKFIEMLLSMGLVCKNYSGKTIATGGGLILLIPSIIGILPAWQVAGIQNITLYIMLVLSMVLMGYLDDSLGDTNIKGLKGHIKAIVNSQLSTGIIKILLGVMTGFIVAIAYYSKGIDILTNTILFSLCVNFINLLDLRPGRGIKGFLGLALIVALWSKFHDTWILIPVIGAIIIYLPDELNETCMLGDTGSNLLGGILGMYVVKTAPLQTKHFLLLILISLHIIAEYWSFSKIIEFFPFLRRIDSFGQLKKERQ